MRFASGKTERNPVFAYPQHRTVATRSVWNPTSQRLSGTQEGVCHISAAAAAAVRHTSYLVFSRAQLVSNDTFLPSIWLQCWPAGRLVTLLT